MKDKILAKILALIDAGQRIRYIERPSINVTVYRLDRIALRIRVVDSVENIQVLVFEQPITLTDLEKTEIRTQFETLLATQQSNDIATYLG